MNKRVDYLLNGLLHRFRAILYLFILRLFIGC